MERDTNLDFIREKIYEIRNAVMYSMSNELVKMPNSIVSALRVDDEGQLWFLCSPPSMKIEECENSFPARLHFYRKGKFFHIEVSGKATIISKSCEDVPETENGKEKPVLLRLNMQQVSYTAMNEKRARTRLETLLENSYKWLLRNIAFQRNEKSVFSRLHQTH